MDITTAKQLGYRDELHHVVDTQDRGRQCARVRVNGQPQTWKTRPDEIRIPVKWGMRGTFQIWHYDLASWERADECRNPVHPRPEEGQQ
jgi:hypothetical protein